MGIRFFKKLLFLAGGSSCRNSSLALPVCLAPILAFSSQPSSSPYWSAKPSLSLRGGDWLPQAFIKRLWKQDLWLCSFVWTLLWCSGLAVYKATPSQWPRFRLATASEIVGHAVCWLELFVTCINGFPCWASPQPHCDEICFPLTFLWIVFSVHTGKKLVVPLRWWAFHKLLHTIVTL